MQGGFHMEEQTPQNKMGTAPISKIMLTIGIPMMVSMMLQAVYNIVDSAFVSNIPGNGEAALNALTLAFPLQMLMVAFSIGTGVGTLALVSKCLGQGKPEKAAHAAGNAMFLGIIICAAYVLFGFFGIDTYIHSQSTNPQIITMAHGYLRICCTYSVGIAFFGIFEKLLQSTGKSMYSTTAQIIGAVINIILDPVFIYGLLGAPALGVEGAAIATVIGQIASFLIAMLFHFRKNKEIKAGFRYLKPSGQIIKEIYSIGVPAIVAQAVMSIMTYGLNIIFVGINENVVTAYGLYYKIQQFILFAALGLRDAITPIVSYNYGMGSKKRIHEGIKYGQLYTLIIMVIGILLLEILAQPFCHVFGLSGETSSLFSGTMRIISLSFVFAGANIAFQSIFQALGEGLPSLIISVCRQLLFVLPVAYAFSLLARKNDGMMWLVWLTFLIAEGATLLIACALMRHIRKKKIESL
jgi:putative MATE family efflux protein